MIEIRNLLLCACALLYTKEVKQTVIFGQYKNIDSLWKRKCPLNSVYFMRLWLLNHGRLILAILILFLFYGYKGLDHSSSISKKISHDNLLQKEQYLMILSDTFVKIWVVCPLKYHNARCIVVTCLLCKSCNAQIDAVDGDYEYKKVFFAHKHLNYNNWTIIW